MSHGAKVLLIHLMARYNTKLHNNGRLYLSQREARKAFGSGYTEITRWYRELQHYGFIVMTAGGTLGLTGKGKAPHWRLTVYGTLADPMPTREFLKWNGDPFTEASFWPRRKKNQNPAPETRSTLLQKPGALNGQSAPEIRSIQADPTAPETRSVSSLPLPAGLGGKGGKDAA
jgi:hypothetical protein